MDRMPSSMDGRSLLVEIYSPRGWGSPSIKRLIHEWGPDPCTEDIHESRATCAHYRNLHDLHWSSTSDWSAKCRSKALGRLKLIAKTPKHHDSFPCQDTFTAAISDYRRYTCHLVTPTKTCKPRDSPSELARSTKTCVLRG